MRRPAPCGSRRLRALVLVALTISLGAGGLPAKAQDATDAFKSFPLGNDHPAGRSGRLPAGQEPNSFNPLIVEPQRLPPATCGWKPS